MLDVDSLYRRYGPMVLRRCRFLLQNEEKALDAMQDTFVRVLQHRGRLTDRGLSGLLYRIATNVCLNLLRSDARIRQSLGSELLATIASSDDHESDFILRNLLESIFKKERSTTREIAVLHYVDGMTHAEVAKEVGLSVSGVRKRLRTLRKRALILKESQEV